ncbi:hypothetical protein CHS0354_016830 [Potamilus streckersoni]|uniref:Uncharacterized protein n=1 Tax=Potamilus streckersoni TaxID=2493646 RepID=A0AAE0W2J2_9BIVA|nr:hypothetical protein CHS0354_016830 [Potamilus streckersoni]
MAAKEPNQGHKRNAQERMTPKNKKRREQLESHFPQNRVLFYGFDEPNAHEAWNNTRKELKQTCGTFLKLIIIKNK